MTKREAFAKLLDMVKGNDELTDFINHEIELLNRKSTSKGVSEEVQKERTDLQDKIFDVLVNAEQGLTVTEIIGKLEIAGLSTSKVTSRLTELKQRNLVESVKIGRKSIYKVA